MAHPVVARPLEDYNRGVVGLDTYWVYYSGGAISAFILLEQLFKAALCLLVQGLATTL